MSQRLRPIGQVHLWASATRPYTIYLIRQPNWYKAASPWSKQAWGCDLSSSSSTTCGSLTTPPCCATLPAPAALCCLPIRDQTTAARFSNSPISDEELDETQSALLLAALSPATASHRAKLTKIAKAVGGLLLALTLGGGYLEDKVMFQQQAAPALAAIQQVEMWLGLADPARHLSFADVLALSLKALPGDADRAAFLRLAAFAAKPASFSLAAL
jgi:hypothetical protein